MNLASVSSTPPVASTCFRCRRAFIFSFSPSPLSLYFPRDSAWPRVRSLRTESDGARIGDTESYGSELLRRPLNSSEEEGSSEEGDDEFVDWEDKILEVTVPLVGFVRMLLHSGKYANQDRLSPEHERTIVEMLLPYHPEVDKKIGCGIDFIMVGHHPEFERSRCLFIVRKDGEVVDFSYWKCIKGLIKKKYPLYADSFILRHFRKRRQNRPEPSSRRKTKMQTVRALRRVTKPSQWVRSVSQGKRSFSALPNFSASDADVQDQVSVEGKAKSRAAILDRPSSLNALSAPMVGRLKRLYESWEENPAISFVLMKGSGKTFCSGADVLPLYHSINEGNTEECKHFFGSLYNFVYLQGTYLKPNIAIMDGVTMGCGGGISIPGMFRVATDKTVLAHPEVQIGFHPDAGASYYLSRLPGYLGEYLALTGQKLDGVEMIACGLATHFCLHSRLGMVEERIGKLLTDDPTVIEASLAQYSDLVYPDNTSVLHKIEMIDRYFGLDTVEEIIEAMENEVADSGNEWCKKTLKQVKEASPLSLKITLQSIREGRFQTLDQCLTREYRISLCGVSKTVSGDFCEGIRARLVDKDFAPKWDPPRLEDVSKDMVDCYFSPATDADDSESELKLPTAQREPYF